MTAGVRGARFVLRRESFGTLLCDARRRRYFRLPGELFGPLRARCDEGREAALRASPQVLEEWDRFVSFCMASGIVAAESEFRDMRAVEHPAAALCAGPVSAPVRVYDYVGFGCNLACRRCLNDSSKARCEPGRRSLSATEAVMTKLHDAGVTEWQFTGGEPTFYDEFLDLVRMARSLGFHVLLNTNGCWDEGRRAAILESGIREVMVSVEGGLEVNDWLRGPGVYDRIIRTVESIAERNHSRPDEERIHLTLNMTYGRQNIGEVERIVDLGVRYGAAVSLLPERPYGRSAPDSLLSKTENLEFLRRVKAIRGKPDVVASRIKISSVRDVLNQNVVTRASTYDYLVDYTTCGPFSSGLGVLPDGRVNICGFLCGNEAFTGKDLSDDTVSVYSAWLDEKLWTVKRATQNRCSGCSFYRAQCLGKCAAMVLADGGEFVHGVLRGTDRYCYAQLVLSDEATKQMEC